MGVGRLICKRSLSLLAGNGSRMMSSSSRVSPCLVLQPQLLKNDMVYKFYSLEKQRVVNWNKRGGGGGGGEEPADVSKIVGSSHGWLALFNESNNELFLSDPLNRKHIRLPSIDTLPDPEINLIQGRGRVSKVILSCSPDADGVQGQECRALMSYGAGDRLAFCSPLSGTHWLPVGDLLLQSEFDDVILQGRACQDFVYCSRRKVFSCITPSLNIVMEGNGDVSNAFHQHQCEWHELDLSPKWIRADILPRFFINRDDEAMPRWIGEMDNWPIQTTYLVYAEETDKLYALVRLIDGSPPPYDRIFSNPHSINDPYVISKYGEDFQCATMGFVALRFDEYGAASLRVSVPNSLDGLAMFVGVNHSFAISASKYPELNLKPNSIYFTDVGSRINGPGWSGHEYGGVDAGIFDYQNNVIMPWFDESSSDSVPHAPLWYTPNIDLD